MPYSYDAKLLMLAELTIASGKLDASHVLQLSYTDGHGDVSARRVRPLAIWAFTDGWLFAVWCERREDFRTFRLDRIASLAETPDRFPDDPRRGLDAYLAAKRLEQPSRRPR